MKAKNLDTSLVNSSYTAFFLVATLVWSFVFSTYFPGSVRTTAFIICLAFSSILYIYYYLLKQFYEGTTILLLIVSYAGMAALATFLSAIKGPIADGTIPAIQILTLNSTVSSSTHPAVIVAAVFTFYGAITLAMSQITAGILELIYTKIYPLLPKVISQQLHKIDAKVDKKAGRFSDLFFLLDERKGLVASLGLLVAYVVLYCSLLMF